MPYTQTTLGDALVDMGSRLYDPTHIRWTEPELTRYIQQAIRTFNALTNHFRAEASFPTENRVAFYDLPTVLPTLRANTTTLSEVVDLICDHLLEPVPTGNLWNGTQQYSLDDILTAIQQARDTFLLETGIIITEASQAVSAPVTQVTLPDAVLNLRRLAFAQANGIVTIVRRDDTWGFTNYNPAWQAPVAAPPNGYSVSTTPPLVVQLGPTSSLSGTIQTLTVNSGAVPNLLDPTQTLGVPDDWVWVVVFGALAQLFQRDGLAVDTPRGNYCDLRWKDGLERAKGAAVVVAATVNGFPTPLGSVSDADTYSPDWPMVPGVPRRAITMGQTLVGLWPPPGVPVGGGSFTVTLDVVRNAPVPVEPTDYLQIGYELVNDVLDYAQHLALLKEGAGPLQLSMGLLEQFIKVCGTTIDLGRASKPNRDATDEQTVQDRRTLAYSIPSRG